MTQMDADTGYALSASEIAFIESIVRPMAADDGDKAVGEMDEE